ncbi:MAG TPA: carboxymuconolactone decarboxylase family protein [Acidobacteriota bacterium]|nr:carboxymuconolactone decarboxylase family protein [Acidobacteriota bacterium]HNH85149.1 carboxymuconolactone decarboxylase family protein [Acidobacteriota bacterium]
MSRLQAIDPQTATGKAKELLDGVQAKLGVTPNLMRTLANSPAVLEAYLNFSGTLAKGKLGAKVREQIALVVADTNQCEYCLAAHSYIGKSAGLTPEAIADSRRATSSDAKTSAILTFAQKLVINRGIISDRELELVKEAGITEGEIAEIIGAVALNIFTNYVNHVAQTEVDFPKVELAASR